MLNHRFFFGGAITLFAVGMILGILSPFVKTLVPTIGGVFAFSAAAASIACYLKK